MQNWLQEIDEYEFEYFVAELWERMGWETEVTQGTADKGIDVIATKHNPYEMKELIQAKRYSANSTVGSPDIQQYASLRHQESNVDTVVVVTTSTFSTQAEQIADDLNVKLIDGTALENLVTKYNCEELVLRYADPSATPNQETSSIKAESKITTSEQSNDSTDIDKTEPQSDPQYGRRGIHILIAILTAWWTLGLVNLTYAAWSYHKTKYADGVPKDYNPAVSDTWYYGIVSSVLIGGVAVSIGMPLSTIIPAVDPIFGFLTMIAWIALPLSIYYDIQYVRANTTWNPITGLWLIGSILLPVNFFVGLFYLLRRRDSTGHDRFTALLRTKLNDEPPTHNNSTDPIANLKQQYTEGELDEEEFDQRMEMQLESESTIEHQNK